MSGLILPNQWTRQPQTPVQIDWSNPLTQGLIGAINAGAPVDTRVGTVPFVATAQGIGHNANGSSYLVTNATRPVGSAATIFHLGNLIQNTAGVGGHTGGIGTTSSGTQLFIIQNNNSGTTKPRALIRLVDAGGVSTAESATLGAGVSSTAIEPWAATYAGTAASLTLYRNGVNDTGGRANTAASGAATALNRVSLGGVDRGTDSFSPSGQITLLSLAWDRALSAAEIKALSANPWQIFKAQSRRIFAAAAASGSTGTVAVTNANDTSSASGTTTVVGTVARTNANDTSTASGTTTVVGTVSVANAADTSSASGTTTVTGTSATTNANDTSAASGSVGDTVTGTVATTNANDTSAASGTTTVTGTLARTNANDTSTASGTTTVTGTAASTNANDTAAASGIAGSITGTVATTNKNDTVSASGTAGSLRTNQGGGWETYVAPIRKKTVKEVKKEFELLSYAEVVAEQKTAEIKIQHTQAKIEEVKPVSSVAPFSLAPEIAKLKLIIAEEKVKIEALRELETKILIHAKIKKEKEKLFADLAFIAEYLMDEDEYDYD